MAAFVCCPLILIAYYAKTMIKKAHGLPIAPFCVFYRKHKGHGCPFFSRLNSMMDMKMENIVMSKPQLANLIQEAKKLGATSSAIISSKEIQVKNSLAALCNGEYACPNYGLAASCPPHVEGPAEFRKWQEQSKYSVTVKIELPTPVMFSDERKGVMQLLHQIVAAVEQKAVEMGFKKSKAFAGGSCKKLFCDDQEKCCVVAENGPCRHIEFARPSMSGFGIDVTQLMSSSGWSGSKAEKSNLAEKDATSWVAGLIMLA